MQPARPARCVATYGTGGVAIMEDPQRYAMAMAMHRQVTNRISMDFSIETFLEDLEKLRKTMRKTSKELEKN